MTTRMTKDQLLEVIEDLKRPLCIKKCARCGAGISAIMPTHKSRGPWEGERWKT